MFLPVYAYNRVGEGGARSSSTPSKAPAASSGASQGSARDLLALATMPRV